MMEEEGKVNVSFHLSKHTANSKEKERSKYSTKKTHLFTKSHSKTTNSENGHTQKEGRGDQELIGQKKP